MFLYKELVHKYIRNEYEEGLENARYITNTTASLIQSDYLAEQCR